MAWRRSLARRAPNTANAPGIVDKAPTATSVEPIWSSRSRLSGAGWAGAWRAGAGRE